MPFAKAVSAKSHDFDAEGNEIHTDYFKMMKIVVDAGYHGYVGIEYEGDKLDEPAGILATKKLLERVARETRDGRCLRNMSLADRSGSREIDWLGCSTDRQ